MIIERVESEGLAHYSYFLGDGKEAAVIDPRRDCQVYVEKARTHGLRIMTILETHRNEDYVIGSPELASRTGAEIWHADGQWAYGYGQAAEDGQEFRVGGLRLRAIHSPGHTPGSMSYLVHDPDGFPWMVFTGDALFAGDVGRVDLLGEDHISEMGHQLYDTLVHRLLPLGDGIIICPAHGPGSACGRAIAGRTWTTIGLERRHNPLLQHRDGTRFAAAVGRTLPYPPYFARMEEMNLQGAPLLRELPEPKTLSVDEFFAAMSEGVVLDTRSELAFAAAHVPGALSVWLAGVPRFTGWFLPFDTPVLLVSQAGYPDEELRYLYRLGYDRIMGYLSGGMHAWHAAGRESASVGTVTVQELCRRLDRNEPMSILDVRSREELEAEGTIPGAQHIHVSRIQKQPPQTARDERLYVFCGSGLRATIAASLLQQHGFRQVTVVLGGVTGWNSVNCPISMP